MLTAEVLGIWPDNKGAMLMLETVRRQLQLSFPNSRLALSLDLPANHRLAHGAWTCIRRERGRVGWRTRAALALMPSSGWNAVAAVPPHLVDVVLDASGFAYGDHWGARKAHDRALARLSGWKTQGKAAIMLPQALGPFTDQPLRATMAQALPLFDLVFARDKQSFAYIKEIAPTVTSVFLAPDFTNLLRPRSFPELERWHGYSLVIPNIKMINPRDATSRSAYIKFLATAATQLVASGRPVALLNHEGLDDLSLAKDVNAVLPLPLEIIDRASVEETKAIISKASAVISSRFHGLVSALSNGVPSLACGWSHKYDELMNDYGSAEFSAKLSSFEHVNLALSHFVSALDGTRLRTVIAQSAEVEREKSLAMWAQVVDVILARVPSAAA